MTVRVLHLAPDYFGDVSLERETLRDRLGDVTMVTDDVDPADPETAVPADILITFGSPVSSELMDATGCSVVAAYATGFDMIDVDGATDRGIRVTRIPEYCDREVGEHVLATILALVRGLPQYDAETGSGGWDWSVANPVFTFESLTLGLFAFGRKAQVVADLANRLGFAVVAHDPYLDDEVVSAANVTPVSYDRLLASADVLSLHAPLTEETRELIDAEAFARMQDGTVLVNAARGQIVDEAALIDALDDGTVAGAGLDVLATEPPDPDHPLLGRDDVIVTPHVAWNSVGAIERVRTRGSEIAAAAYEGHEVDGVVNPEVC